MEKFIPYEKLSKKKKRELDLKARGSWGGLNPVTRMPPNPKAYNRRKAQKWSDDSGSAPYVFSWEEGAETNPRGLRVDLSGRTVTYGGFTFGFCGFAGGAYRFATRCRLLRRLRFLRLPEESGVKEVQSGNQWFPDTFPEMGFSPAEIFRPSETRRAECLHVRDLVPQAAVAFTRTWYGLYLFHPKACGDR